MKGEVRESKDYINRNLKTVGDTGSSASLHISFYSVSFYRLASATHHSIDGWNLFEVPEIIYYRYIHLHRGWHCFTLSYYLCVCMCNYYLYM